MIADALVWKYGQSPGLCITHKDGVDGFRVDGWPSAWGRTLGNDEILGVLAEYRKHLKSVQYIESRQAEYPGVGDQLDAIMKWVAGENEIDVTPELKSIAMRCMGVKSRHPKPKKEG